MLDTTLRQWYAVFTISRSSPQHLTLFARKSRVAVIPFLRVLVVSALTVVIFHQATGPAHGVLISVDNSVDGGLFATDSTGGTISNFTVGNNDQRMLVVVVGGERPRTPDGVSYGGVPLTHAASGVSTSGGGSFTSIWTLDSPAVGTADIQISNTLGASNNNGWRAGALSLFSDGLMSVIDSDSAFVNSGGSTITLNLSNIDMDDDFFFVGIAEKDSDGAFGATPDLNNLINGNSGGFGGFFVNAGSDFFFDGATTSFTWNTSGERRAAAGIAIQALEIPVIPEPASMAVWLVAGAIAVGLFGFRRRCKTGRKNP